MDSGNSSLTDLRNRLESQEDDRAYVRALLKRTGAIWILHHVSALVGSEPPNWAEVTWQYEHLAFVACNVPASTLAKLCSEAVNEPVLLGQFQVTAPAAQQFVQWTHQPSFALHERLPVPWPTTSYTVSAGSPNDRTVQPGILVAESCPSFPEPNSAWRAFNESDYSLSGAQAVPNHLAEVRIAEREGWIGPVHISPTEMTVDIEGDTVAGSELELYGTTGRTARNLDGPGTVVFPLASGLPEHAWLWLKRGTNWLDYRSVFPQSGWTGNLRQAGVEIEAPVDPQANVEALIAMGEGPQVEFKEMLPTSSTRRTLKTVAAFASGDGGTVVFGINRDEVTVTGLGSEDPTKLRDQLTNMVRATIIPMPQVHPRAYTVQDKTILVLEVAPGPSTPYGLIADGSSRDKPEYYVRRGASTYPAQPGELREAVINRTGSTNSSG